MLESLSPRSLSIGPWSVPVGYFMLVRPEDPFTDLFSVPPTVYAICQPHVEEYLLYARMSG